MGSTNRRDNVVFDPARTEIRALIEGMRRDLPSLSISEIGRRAVFLRQLGARHGFDPVRQLAGGLADAIARDGRGAVIGVYLDSLGEAVFCDSSEASASELFLAAVSVRLAS